MIYFIQAEHGGPIKIGWTEGRPNLKYGDIFLERRRKALQTGNPYPLVVRHVTTGERDGELLLHSKFKEHRLVGEWFEPAPELVELAAGYVDPSLESKIEWFERVGWSEYSHKRRLEGRA